jgi:hypothetical protein
MFVLVGAFEQPSAPLVALTGIEFVWEASLAIYLIVKGYRRHRCSLSQASCRDSMQAPCSAYQDGG